VRLIAEWTSLIALVELAGCGHIASIKYEGMALQGEYRVGHLPTTGAARFYDCNRYGGEYKVRLDPARRSVSHLLTVSTPTPSDVAQVIVLALRWKDGTPGAINGEGYQRFPREGDMPVLKSMMRARMIKTVLLASSVLYCGAASAVTMWTNWTTATVGAPGSATGTVGGVGVSYSGELDASAITGTSNIWSPASSFVGGTSTASPISVNDDLRLNGDFTGTNSITFASPVENPLIAIWSLGQPGVAATFNFTATPTLEAGGPNSQFGGQSITVNGNVVSGNEGNGVVQFTGTFSSISWTNTPENFYAFTAGINGRSTPVSEPGEVALFGLALVALVACRHFKK
jgi:hypothetical protein